jgi:hypothetical protein
MMNLWSVLALLPLVAGIFEDQAGQLDWRRENIGKLEHVIYQGSKRSMFVASASNVIASTNVRSGKIEWRHVLQESIDKIIHHQKLFVVVSNKGRNVRVFNPNDGALLWESIVRADGNHEGDAVAADENGLAVIRGNSVHMLSYNTGEKLWSWSAKSGVTLKQLQWDKGRVLAIGESSNGKSSSLFVGALDANGQVVGDAKESKETSGSIWDKSVVVTAPLDDASEGNALAYSTVVISLLEDGKTLSLWDLHKDKKAEVATSSIAESVSSISSVAPSTDGCGVPAVVLKTKSGAHVVTYVDVKGASPTAKKVKEFSEGNRVFGAVASPASWPAENQQQLITTAAIGKDGAVLEIFNAVNGEETAKGGTTKIPAVTTDSHGDAVSLFPQLFSKRDGSVGTRVLLTAQDHAAIMLQPGREDKENKKDKSAVLWLREEALASVTESAFVDYEAASEQDTSATEIPSLDARLQLQVVQLIDTATSVTGLIEAISAKAQGISTSGGDGDSAKTQDFGLDKLILLMTAPGKLFALHTSSGRVVWSRLFQGYTKMMITRSKPSLGHKYPEVLLPAAELSSDGTRQMLWVNGATGAEIETGSVPAGFNQHMSLASDQNFNSEDGGR